MFLSVYKMAKKGHFQSPFQVNFEAADPASQTVFLSITKKRHLIFWMTECMVA